jgi:hypothetical protein
VLGGKPQRLVDATFADQFDELLLLERNRSEFETSRDRVSTSSLFYLKVEEEVSVFVEELWIKVVYKRNGL